MYHIPDWYYRVSYMPSRIYVCMICADVLWYDMCRYTAVVGVCYRRDYMYYGPRTNTIYLSSKQQQRSKTKVVVFVAHEVLLVATRGSMRVVTAATTTYSSIG